MAFSAVLVGLGAAVASCHGVLPAPTCDSLVARLILSPAPQRSTPPKSPFFATLAELGRRQKTPGVGPTDFSNAPVVGYARIMVAEGKRYVLVVVTFEPISVPGASADQLLLLDESGMILDSLSYGINSRYGRIMTGLPTPRPNNQARIALRCQAHPGLSPPPWYTITSGSTTNTFQTNREQHPAEPTPLTLLQATICKGKFVVFPASLPNCTNHPDRQ